MTPLQAIPTNALTEAGRRLGRHIVSAVGDEPAHALTLKLALILALLYGASSSAVEVPVRILATVMLVFPTFLTQPALWWLLTVALVAGNARDWYTIDNHKYLITYWVLACTISLHVRERHQWLGGVARTLTVLVFGFAVLWKLVGGEYLNGSFLYYTFLTDSRLTRLSAAVTGTPFGELSLLPRAVEFLGDQGTVGTTLMLPTVPSLLTVALTLSWLTLAIEGAIGAVHVSGQTRFYPVRHFSLMTFVALTYFLLPVTGFASILLLMGLAQCRADDTRMRFRYLLMLGVMQLTLIPWKNLLLAQV